MLSVKKHLRYPHSGHSANFKDGDLTFQATEARLKQSERGVAELQAALEAAQQDAVEAATMASRADKELRTQQSMSAQQQRLLRQVALALSIALASYRPALTGAVREGKAAKILPVLASQLLTQMPAPLQKSCSATAHAGNAVIYGEWQCGRSQ